jgi:predicted 3-demethylubiquinone-9 3-methyltransferase (glyoxalase superfamily)
MQKITPFLWFDGQAEEVVNYHVSIFTNSRISTITRYDEARMRSSAAGSRTGTASPGRSSAVCWASC